MAQKSIFIIVFCILFNISPSFSQATTDLAKYWFYRNRLKYFVVPGTKIGESQIICVRNRIYSDNDPYIEDGNKIGRNVDYGQHGKYAGLYIGVLATEYYLLNDNGQYTDANKTYSELYLALNAFKTY